MTAAMISRLPGAGAPYLDDSPSHLLVGNAVNSSRQHPLRRMGLAAAMLTFLVPGWALAQTTPQRVRGTIERAEGAQLVVTAREGGEVSIKLPDPPRVSAVIRKTLADIGPGSFVGVAGMPMPDGSQRALAVSILPEAARANSFHSAWDLMPESTMTNAAVSETVKGVSGDTLKVSYKDGEKSIVVTPETSIVGFAPATPSDLKPGTRVVVFAHKAPDGTLTAGNVVVGRDGVDPPM